MHGKVFGAGMGLQDGSIGISLESTHYGHAKLTGQEGIFTVGFHAAPPSGITEDVDVRCPEGNALGNFYLPFLPCLAEFDPPLVAYRHKHFMYKRFVEGGGHSHGLRKTGGLAIESDSVQGLAPPVVFLYSQPLYGLRVICSERCLLFQCQPRYQVPGADIGRQAPVQECLGSC